MASPIYTVSVTVSDEVRRFVATIPLKNQDGRPYFRSLRFRALLEVLLGTAMRIGEALSLNHDQIDLESREVRIIGKGSGERIVFFTDRALYWLAAVSAAPERSGASSVRRGEHAASPDP